MYGRMQSLVGLMTVCFTVAVQASPINQVAYGSIASSALLTFDGLGSAPPGTNYDNVLVLSGAAFGERFDGQTRTSSPLDYDVLSGTPTGPLNAVAGSPGQNLVVFLDEGVQSEVLAGLGPLGYPARDAIGEGSFAVRFDADQSELGFQLVGGARGSATVTFFRGDGSLIAEIVLQPLLESAFFGFGREGGIQDIAGFSIFNDDLGGIAIDNVKFSSGNGQPAPEPSTLALLGLGFAALAARKRKT